jgi:hypothetical protein
MTIITVELPLRVTVSHRASMDSLLDAAVANARAAAHERRCGILVTRHGSHDFTVELSDAVPHGITCERQEW